MRSPLVRGSRGRGGAAPRRNDGEIAADHIRDMIVGGTLRRGERIVPDDIADELGVSRIPVREGIIALEREGWVDLEPRRGSFVHGIDRPTVRDHYALLGSVHGFIAVRAAQRSDDADVLALGARERALERADCIHDSTDACTAFLGDLGEAARSVRGDRVLRVLPEYVPAESLDQRPQVMKIQRDGVRSMMRGLRERDSTVAANAARVTYGQLGSRVEAFLDARGVFGAETDDIASPTRAHWYGLSGRRGSARPAAAEGGAERAVRYVRDQIIRGEFAPHERLDRATIGKALGLSGTPMREAVVALEREGWITIEPHRGAFVNAFDADYIRDHYEIFAIIFGTATTLTVERAGDAAVQRLLTLNEALQQAETAAEFERIDFEMLDLLVSAAASTPLVSVLRTLPQIIPGNFFARVPGALEAQRKGFDEVCAALRAGGTAGIETAWWSLMSGVATCVVEFLGESALPRRAS
jgi:DNA-binding GntR family transcriptional regulator